MHFCLLPALHLSRVPLGLLLLGFWCLSPEHGLAQAETNNKYNVLNLLTGIALYPDSICTGMISVLEQPEALGNWEQRLARQHTNFERWWAKIPAEKRSEFTRLMNEPEIAQGLLFADTSKSWNVSFENASSGALVHLDEFADLDETLPQYATWARKLRAGWIQVGNQQPESLQAGFRQLQQQPAITRIFRKETPAAMELAEFCSSQPGRCKTLTDSIRLSYQRIEALTLDRWSKLLLRDPEVQAALREVGNEFAGVFGFDEADFRQPPNLSEPPSPARFLQLLLPDTGSLDQPFWAYTGFYYSSQGDLIGVTLPNAFFMNWYLSIPEHHAYFPKVTALFLDLQRNLQGHQFGFSLELDRWKSKLLPSPETLESGPKRIAAIQQVGERSLSFSGNPSDQEGLRAWIAEGLKQLPETEPQEQEADPSPRPPGNPGPGSNGPVRLAPPHDNVRLIQALALHAHFWAISE